MAHRSLSSDQGYQATARRGPGPVKLDLGRELEFRPSEPVEHRRLTGRLSLESVGRAQGPLRPWTRNPTLATP